MFKKRWEELEQLQKIREIKRRKLKRNLYSKGKFT